jgi:hypothetical protein
LPFGKYRIGQIVDDSDYYIKRKVDEGGCLIPVNEDKQMKSNYENKMMDVKTENKNKKQEDK